MDQNNAVEEFDIDAFLDNLDKDKSKKRENSLVKLFMNTPDNQGTVMFVPFVSKEVGNIYLKLTGVKEFYGETALNQNGESWFKILPKKMYGELDEEDEKLYDEVDELYKEINDSEMLDFTEIRTKTYSIFYGVLIKQSNVDGESITDNVDHPALFIYSGNYVINALNTAISTKQSVLGDRTKKWLSQVITPSPTGRKGVLVIDYRKNEGPGYGATVTFELNTEFNEIVDPNKVFSEELIAEFDDPLKSFLGWMYDYDNHSYFNRTAFLELKDNLQDTLNRLNEEVAGESEAEVEEAVEEPEAKEEKKEDDEKSSIF